MKKKISYFGYYFMKYFYLILIKSTLLKAFQNIHNKMNSKQKNISKKEYKIKTIF